MAARTQQYDGSGGGSNTFVPSLQSHFEITDPSRPFVCQHCGVGFAREKALASHARVSTLFDVLLHDSSSIIYRF